MQYDFEWDSDKARANRAKHGVAFEDGATVFKDPRALSVYDDEHSGTEEWWITLGISASGVPVVVHHTFEAIGDLTVRIRIFSCRKPTKNELSHYGE
jgi:uncharacterized DUF497 family protein